MLPSPDTRWFRSPIVALLLATAVPALLVLPARHALIEVWPGRVEEWVLADGSRVFSPPEQIAPAVEQVVARSRPLSLLTFELDDGEAVQGFVLSGSIHAEDDLIIDDGVATQQIDTARIRRAYRPNALTAGERLQLTLDRLRDLRQPTEAPGEPSLDDAVTAPDSVESDNI